MGSLDFEQILAGIKPKTCATRVCLDGDLFGEHATLVQQLTDARKLDLSENRHAEAPAIAARIHELELAMAERAVEFTFVAVGQKAWTDLLVQHRPEPEDREVGYEFNPRTFPQAAVALSVTNPRMTPDQAQQLFDALNYGQWQTVWRACLAANVDGADVPFSLAASVVLHGSETKSGRPAITESPDPSS